MPNGHGPPSAQRARHGEPQPAPGPSSEPATTKRDLTSWWKNFSKRGAPKKDEEKEPEVRGIFGVPLFTSIPYANVAISLYNDTGEAYIYGYVPIVVAKCGVFLKEKATDVEGIFRLAGSEKRIKELRTQFDTPPRWGKGLDWTGYTVHDAANILRRYFNQLPEPIIPLSHYDPFRQPLQNHQAEAVGSIEGQKPSVGGFDPDAAVRTYQRLIKELPSLNRQLLLYILDLLAVFAAKSDVNKMTTSNLSAIFQPGILSHPQHDMAPVEYRLSQDVLIFLIDNQDHFLIGMEGTAVDEGTVKHIESGPPTPQSRTPTTPGRTKSGLGRSASAASSAAAESIRKFGGVRRNVSTSSRQSRHSGALPSPITPIYGTPAASGVHRSNTVPSKKSPAVPGARFSREKNSDPPTPATGDHSRSQSISAVAAAPPPTIAQPQPPSQTKGQPTIPSEKIDVVRPAVTEEKIDVVKAAVPGEKPDVVQRSSPEEHTDAAKAAFPENTQPAVPVAPVAPAAPADTIDAPKLPDPAATPGDRITTPPAVQTVRSMLDIHTPPPARAMQAPAPVPQPVPVAQPNASSEQAPVPPPASIPQPVGAFLPVPVTESIPGAFVSPASSEDTTPTALGPSTGEPSLSASTPQRQVQPADYLGSPRETPEAVATPGQNYSQAPPEFHPTQRTFTQILAGQPSSSDEKEPEKGTKEKRQPKKLQKKPRVASGAYASAHSSTHSLPSGSVGDAPPSPLPHATFPSFPVGGSKDVLHSYNADTASSRHSGATLKPTMSPSASFRSHSTATEYSEAEETQPKEEKKSFWRSHKRGESKATPTASQTDLGSVPGAEKSMSSFGSGSGTGRRSLQYDSRQGSDMSSIQFATESKDHEKKSPFGWFREKKQEWDKHHRAKSPPAHGAFGTPGGSSDLLTSQHLVQPNEGLAVRGRSMDVPRTATNEGSKGSSNVTPTGASPQPPMKPAPV